MKYVISEKLKGDIFLCGKREIEGDRKRKKDGEGVTKEKKKGYFFYKFQTDTSFARASVPAHDNDDDGVVESGIPCKFPVTRYLSLP